MVDREARGNENLDGALSIGDDEPTHAAGGDVVHGVEGIGVGRDESEIADGRQLGSSTTSVSGPAASTSARAAPGIGAMTRPSEPTYSAPGAGRSRYDARVVVASTSNAAVPAKENE